MLYMSLSARWSYEHFVRIFAKKRVQFFRYLQAANAANPRVSVFGGINGMPAIYKKKWVQRIRTAA